MNVALRSILPCHIEPVVELWNRCLSNDPITPERFWRLFLLDPNFSTDGAIVAEVDGEVVGFLQAMASSVASGISPELPIPGYITVFFVAPEHGRQGVATRLLGNGLEYLRQRGCRRVTCNGYSPYFLFPGVDLNYAEALSFLDSQKFSVISEPVAMSLRLEHLRVPDSIDETKSRLESLGYSVRQFRREDTLPLLAFAEQHFPDWKPSVLSDLVHGNLTMTVAIHGNEVVGFTQWENTHTDPPSGSPGRFGPFGVRADLRSQGIGAVIFFEAAMRARANGARYLWFGWAGGRNLSFYERAGCKVMRRFRLMGRDL